MIRSTYRNIMLTVLAACFGISFYLFRMSQDIQVEITERENDITRLNQELENAQSLNVALTELDNLTITEQTATQLDILRHLGLEQTEIGFQMESRDVQNLGTTSLYTHNVRITGIEPYDQALALCDRLQNTKKIVLTSVEINVPSVQASANVNFSIAGKIYGLDKTLPAAGTVASSPTVVAPVSDPSATSPTVTTSPTIATSGSVPVAAGASPTVSVTAPVTVSSTATSPTTPVEAPK